MAVISAFHLVVGKHFVEPTLLDIEDFTAQRQNRLVAPVAPLLRAPAGAIALNNE
jgi:hypothetical protein